jgi:glycerol-3-phosphate dehydrogenase subunit B
VDRVGVKVVGADTDGDRIEALRLADGGTHEASQVVLATGGVLGGGVESDRESVRERLFGCHVAAPADRDDWAAEAAFGAHEFARFGVDVDADLRPLTAAGDPEFDNLRAAGHVLGGFDFAAEKSGSGVSLATGYEAGRRAVKDH